MPSNQVEKTPSPAVPVMDVTSFPKDFTGQIKFAAPTDEDMTALAQLRSSTPPWKDRNETPESSLESLSKLRPFIHVGKYQGQLVGYFTIERDGPVPGAAYLRNIVVKPELRRHGVGACLLEHSVQVSRDTLRKTLALRVDPSNGTAVAFFRKAGFTTVQTVVSKKNGKLRLLMSKELQA